MRGNDGQLLLWRRGTRIPAQAELNVSSLSLLECEKPASNNSIYSSWYALRPETGMYSVFISLVTSTPSVLQCTVTHVWLYFQVICPQIGTAVLKGLRARTYSFGKTSTSLVDHNALLLVSCGTPAVVDSSAHGTDLFRHCCTRTAKCVCRARSPLQQPPQKVARNGLEFLIPKSSSYRVRVRSTPSTGMYVPDTADQVFS